jgi:Ca2+-binding EF-hand superfamily protein
MGAGFAKLGGLSIKKMRNVFDDFDKDGSGTVDHVELLLMMDELKIGAANPENNEEFLEE